MTPIDPPHVGRWTLPDFPDQIWIDVGPWRRTFKKARWKQPYARVVEQYREDVPRGSMHLFVYDNGTFAIDHVDDDNPDHGRVIEHMMNDTPVGPIVAASAVVAGAALVTAVIASALREV